MKKSGKMEVVGEKGVKEDGEHCQRGTVNNEADDAYTTSSTRGGTYPEWRPSDRREPEM